MERQVSEIHRLVEVGFERLDGKIDRLTLRLDHQAEAHAQTRTQVEKLDSRVDAVERAYVTVEQLDALRQHLDERAAEKARTWPAWAGVVVALAAVVVAVVMPLVAK